MDTVLRVYIVWLLPWAPRFVLVFFIESSVCVNWHTAVCLILCLISVASEPWSDHVGQHIPLHRLGRESHSSGKTLQWQSNLFSVIKELKLWRGWPQGQRPVQNGVMCYLKMPQLSKSVQFAHRSKNLLKLNMKWQRSIRKRQKRSHLGSPNPKYSESDHLALLFCRIWQRHVQRFTMHVYYCNSLLETGLQGVMVVAIVLIKTSIQSKYLEHFQP